MFPGEPAGRAFGAAQGSTAGIQSRARRAAGAMHSDSSAVPLSLPLYDPTDRPRFTAHPPPTTTSAMTAVGCPRMPFPPQKGLLRVLLGNAPFRSFPLCPSLCSRFARALLALLALCSLACAAARRRWCPRRRPSRARGWPASARRTRRRLRRRASRASTTARTPWPPEAAPPASEKEQEQKEEEEEEEEEEEPPMPAWQGPRPRVQP